MRFLRQLEETITKLVTMKPKVIRTYITPRNSLMPQYGSDLLRVRKTWVAWYGNNATRKVWKNPKSPIEIRKVCKAFLI